MTTFSSNESPDDSVLASLVIDIGILRGRNLPARDKLFGNVGKKTTSDPYAVLYWGGKKIDKTSTVQKSLSPDWNSNFQIKLKKDRANEFMTNNSLHQLKICVYDEDIGSADDGMGVAVVPLPLPNNTEEQKPRWYKMEPGDVSDKSYYKKACGDIEVKITMTAVKLKDDPAYIKKRRVEMQRQELRNRLKADEEAAKKAQEAKLASKKAEEARAKQMIIDEENARQAEQARYAEQARLAEEAKLAPKTFIPAEQLKPSEQTKAPESRARAETEEQSKIANSFAVGTTQPEKAVATPSPAKKLQQKTKKLPESFGVTASFDQRMLKFNDAKVFETAVSKNSGGQRSICDNCSIM